MKLKIGDVVEVRQIVKEGVLVRDKWRRALVVQIERSGFAVQFADDKTMLALPFDKGNNELWR